MYIGETRRTTHEQLNELRHTLKRTDLMPWHDPIPEAPSLRAWQDAEGFTYACSAAQLDSLHSGTITLFWLNRLKQYKRG
jgi:hypothetical protein